MVPLTDFLKKKIAEIEAGDQAVTASMANLAKGGPPPYDPNMEARVSVLENEVKHIRKDLDEIRSALGQIASKLSELPTKRDLSSWTWQFVAVGAGVIAIVIGGIIGGLSWIQAEPGKQAIYIQSAPPDQAPQPPTK